MANLSDPRAFGSIHPLQVHCEGWHSDTVSLERNGWRFVADDDPMRQRFTIRMVNARRVCYGISFSTFDHREVYQRDFVLHGDPFSRIESGHEEIKRIMGGMNLYMEDAMHTERENQMMNKSVYELFPQSANPQYADEEKEIYLPDKQTVDELLSAILEKQAPEQQVLREKARKRSKREASIILLEEAA